VRESALDLALKAQSMLRPGAAAQAVQLLERALELEPGNAWTQGLLARALYLDNQPERALEIVEAVLVSTPDDPMALLLRDQLLAGGEEADREGFATLPDWTGKRVVVLDPGTAAWTRERSAPQGCGKRMWPWTSPCARSVCPGR
jgi:predicted Zn-dependent protease